MVRHAVDPGVPAQHVQLTFHVAIGRAEELLDEETDHDRPFIGRGSADPFPPLPEGKRIYVLPYARHC